MAEEVSEVGPLHPKSYTLQLHHTGWAFLCVVVSECHGPLSYFLFQLNYFFLRNDWQY